MINPEEKNLLPRLPKAVQSQIDLMHSGQTLGASRNLRQINDLFCMIADNWDTTSSFELVGTILKTGDVLALTRGKNTPAIGNAISMVLQGLDDFRNREIGEIQTFINERRTQFNAESLRKRDLIANYGANVLKDCKTILPFDYSSSQMAVLKKLAERGEKLNLIVPESRDLDGGRPIVREGTEMGHTVHFMVDFAFTNYMREVDAVLIGAETIFANGDCWNTVGNFAICLAAQYFHVPMYVATELIKIDGRSFCGIRKEMKLDDYSKLLGYPETFQYPELIRVDAPAFDNVPANMIDAYITEEGVFPPASLWDVSLRYLQSINKSPFGENLDE